MSKVKKKYTIIILIVSIIFVILFCVSEVRKHNYSNQIENIFSQCIYNYGEVHNKYISYYDAKKISDCIRKKNTRKDFELRKLEIYTDKTNWKEQYTWVQVYYCATSGIYKDGEAECYKCYFEIKEGDVYIKQIELPVN